MSDNIRFYFYLIILAPFVGYFTYYTIGFDGRQALSYLALPIFIIFLQHKKTEIVIPKFIYLYIVYIAYVYIWNIINGYIDEKGWLKYLFNNFHIYFVFILIVIYNTKLSNKSYSNFVILIKVILFIAIAGAIVQFLIDPNWMIIPFEWEYNEGIFYIDRRPSIFTYVGPNDYGISVLAFFSLILSIQLNNKNFIGMLIFIIITGLYSFLSNSRYVMMGFILVFAQIFFGKKKSNLISYIIFSSLAFIVIFYVYTNIFGVDLHTLGEKRLFAEGSITATSRYGAYINFLRFFPENPIFGNGFQVSDKVRDASNAIGSSRIHVGYFSHLVSYGLVGGVLLFSFWFSLARDLYRKAKHTAYYGSFFAFLVFLFANATFPEFNLFYPGIIFAFVFSEYYYQLYNNNIKLKEQH